MKTETDREVEQMVNQEIDMNEYIENIMDTPDDLTNFKFLNDLSGIIKNNGSTLFYQTVYAHKLGKFTPLVLTSDGRFHPVKNNVNEILKENEYREKDEQIKLSEITEENKYHFFQKNNVTYRFKEFYNWNNSHYINTVSNDAIKDVIDQRIPTKKVYDEVWNTIREYFYHIHPEEYDILAIASIVSYIKYCLGNVFYLIYLGGFGTGKSTAIQLLSYLQFRGFFTGKGTVPASSRLIHGYGIDLNQDEFEKMETSERTFLIGIYNNGFNKNGRYTLCNMNRTDFLSQPVSLKTYGMKSFTCNDLTGFDSSFIDRCHVTLGFKQNKSLKELTNLSIEEKIHFQRLRDKLFVYTLFNWKSIIDEIKSVKKELESSKVFGRETDKNSIILGIVRHFKGEQYADGVKKYLSEKAPVLQMEYTLSIEQIILKTIVLKSNEIDNKGIFIDISNEKLYYELLSELDMRETDRYAPSNQKPRKILDSLGLTTKAENLGFNHAGRRVYHINRNQLINVLESHKYHELLKLMGSVKHPSDSPNPPNPSADKTKNAEESEEFEESEGGNTGNTLDLNNKIKQVKQYLKKHDDVDYQELCIGFEKDFIDHLERDGLIIRIPTGCYQWIGG